VSLGPDAQQFGLHDFASLGVEARKRFIHEQDFRVDAQGSRQIDALTHAARKLTRII
jgi:hypothetical protein